MPPKRSKGEPKPVEEPKPKDVPVSLEAMTKRLARKREAKLAKKGQSNAPIDVR